MGGPPIASGRSIFQVFPMSLAGCKHHLVSSLGPLDSA